MILQKLASCLAQAIVIINIDTHYSMISLSQIPYEALSSRFQETKAQYDAVTAEIARLGIRRREFDRFIRSVEALPEMLTEFSEELWGALVDHLTVYSKDNIVFTLTSGTEIKA